VLGSSTSVYSSFRCSPEGESVLTGRR